MFQLFNCLSGCTMVCPWKDYKNYQTTELNCCNGIQFVDNNFQHHTTNKCICDVIRLCTSTVTLVTTTVVQVDIAFPKFNYHTVLKHVNETCTSIKT